MIIYLLIVLLATALCQILGAFFSGFFIDKFDKYHNKVLIAEIAIMFLISIEIIYVGITISLFSLIGVLAGIVLVFMINIFVPHKHVDGFERLGLLVFIAMCIHEFPEGIAFGSTFLLDSGVGLLTAVLISLHNIPEGAIIVIPYLLKKKFKQAFVLTIVTQILYVLGGLAAFFFLADFSPAAQAFSACIAAGAMLFIAFEELNFLK